MTTPPVEPRDERTPADAAEGALDRDELLGGDDPGDGPGDGNDPTTEADEDPRLA